jgi:hypothetical protein
VLAFLIAPAGFYAGLTDAYLAHHLYSGSVPETEWCDTAEHCRFRPSTDCSALTSAKLAVPATGS